MLVCFSVVVRLGLTSLDVQNSGEQCVATSLSTIQEAINHAKEGDVIFIHSGTYYEHAIVNKSVSLVGENPNTTIIDGNGTGPVLTVTANNVTVTGFTVQNGGLNGNGIEVHRSDGSTIYNNRILKNFVGINVGGYVGARSVNNIIHANNITNNRYGVFLSYSNNNLITDNKISYSGWDGIELDWADHNTICGNTISYSAEYGFEIPIYAPSYGNTVYHNNFINNTTQALDNDKRLSNSWDCDGEGNYWSDYNGEDMDNDGIGDITYIVKGYPRHEDQHPLMGWFRTFNIFLEDTTYNVTVISNSTVSNFQFDPNKAKINFSITGADESKGFCRVAIPGGLLWCNNPSEWTVRIDNENLSYRIIEEPQNKNYTIIYFTYNQTILHVQIKGLYAISEFPSVILLPLLFITTLVATIVIKSKKRPKFKKKYRFLSNNLQMTVLLDQRFQLSN